MTEVNKLFGQPKTNESKPEDSRRTELGGPDEAFTARQPGGQSGNAPATTDELESAEAGAEVQTELNEVSTIGNVENSILQSAETAGETSGKTWTSHPIARFALGRFQFDSGTLTLTKDSDIEEFEKLLNHPNLSPRDRAVVKEVSVDRANEIARQFVQSRKQNGATSSEDATFKQEA